MHERFSDRARHAMALANLEATKLNHNFLSPAHTLLGLIAEGHGVAAATLRILDVDLDKVREDVRQALADIEPDHPSFGLRAQTNETKQVISVAIEEARKLGHKYVGTEHLVLALMQVGGSIPANVLSRHGLEVDAVREKTLAILRSSEEAGDDLSQTRLGDFEWVHQQELAKAFRSPKFWHTLILAVDSANRLGAGEIEPAHLLLALLRDSEGDLAKQLAKKGVTADWVRETLAAGSAVC